MADSTTISSGTVIWASIISSSSAIIASSVTQVLIAQNIRKNNERKETVRYKRSNFKKAVKIGESFYFLFTETLFNYYALKNSLISEKETITQHSMDYLENQAKTINHITNKLTAEITKHSLTEIYFGTDNSITAIAKDIAMLNNLMAEKMNLLANYYAADEDEQHLIKFEVVAIQDSLIKYIEKIIARIERDLSLIKTKLTNIEPVS